MAPQVESQADLAAKLFGRLWEESLEDPFAPAIIAQLPLLKRRAEKGIAIDSATSLSVLGGIAALGNDPKTMERHFERAIRDEKRNIFIRSNYGMCLRYFGAYARAYEQNAFVVSVNDTKPLFLFGLISSCLGAGRFHEALEQIVNLQKLKPEIKWLDIEEIKQAAVLLKQHKISDEAVEASLNPVAALLWESKVPVHGVDLDVITQDGEPWIELHFNLFCSVEEAAELEWELCGRLPGGPGALGDTSPLKWVVPGFSGVYPAKRHAPGYPAERIYEKYPAALPSPVTLFL